MRSVPGPSRWIASNRRSVSLRALALRTAMRSAQAASGVRLVEASDVLDVRPEPLVRLGRRELRVDELRPGRMRGGNDAPVGRAVGDDLRVLLQARELILAEAVGIEVGEQVRHRDPAERDPGTVAGGVREPRRAEPVRHERRACRPRRARCGRASGTDRSRRRRRTSRRACTPPSRPRAAASAWPCSATTSSTCPRCRFAPATASSPRRSQRSATGRRW